MLHYEAITFAADFVVQPCSYPSCSGVRTASIRTRYTAISLPWRKRNENDPVLLFRGVKLPLASVQNPMRSLLVTFMLRNIERRDLGVHRRVRTEHADDELAKVEENGVDV